MVPPANNEEDDVEDSLVYGPLSEHDGKVSPPSYSSELKSFAIIDF